MLALNKDTGAKLWEANVNAPIGQVGPSIGDGMLFIPTGKIQGLPKEERVGICSCTGATMKTSRISRTHRRKKEQDL